MNSSGKPPGSKYTGIERVADALIRWVPFGGGVWSFAGALFQGNISQALVMFPVTLVTVIWAAYTKNFIARCREIAESRGRKDPDTILSWLGLASQNMQWQFSGLKGQYLRAQANACSEYVIEGYSKTRWKFLLKEVYIPLEISSEVALNHSKNRTAVDFSSAEDGQRQGLSLWSLLRKANRLPAYRQMAVLAKGGYGKTTLLRHVTYSYAVRGRSMKNSHNVPVLIPFLLYLRDWSSEIAKDDVLDLSVLITNYHIPKLPGARELNLPVTWVRSVLKGGRALVMFDGFDEVSEEKREKVGQWISRQMVDYPSSVFILTSRPEGYEEYRQYPGIQRLSSIYVKEFNQKQRNQFIQKWYLHHELYERADRNTPEVRSIAKEGADSLIVQINERSELSEMAKNPLMLNMIASVHRFSPGKQLPDRRTDLYSDICRMQLWDRPVEKYITMLLRPKLGQAILQKIALQMTERNIVKLPAQEMVELASSSISQLTENLIDARKFIEQIKSVSELLTERDPHEYEFSHRNFQDYLTACELVDSGQEDLAVRNLEKKWWRETILLYSELTNPTGLIEAACQSNSYTAIDLAYRCLQIGTNRTRVAQDLQKRLEVAMPPKERLQNIRYAKLETLLRHEKWKEADNETYELMIRTVGKDIGQKFSVNDLNTFPCEDLQRLDSLWRSCSRERFGFSIQRDIYSSCGDLLKKQHNSMTTKKFAERVEWSRGKRIKWNIDAPRGHLPVVSGSVGTFKNWEILFLRVQNCKI